MTTKATQQKWDMELAKRAKQADEERERKRLENPLERIADALEHIADALGYDEAGDCATVAETLDSVVTNDTCIRVVVNAGSIGTYEE